MLEEKFSEIIKKIRKENKLTQKDLADKYHVTYQAVSKWENGKSLPDISLMKQIGQDYNISIDDMLSGNFIQKKFDKRILLFFLIMPLFIIFYFLIVSGNNDFESKTISSMCNDYKIYGIISYNTSKSVIYIPKIEYCGEKNNQKYQLINCTLYEKHNDIKKEISTYNYDGDLITIEDFLKQVTFNVDNYLKVCNDYNKNSLYLEIMATDNKEMFFHTIPLSLDDSCH